MERAVGHVSKTRRILIRVDKLRVINPGKILTDYNKIKRERERVYASTFIIFSAESLNNYNLNITKLDN